MAKRNMSAARIAANWNAGMQNAVNSGAIAQGVQAVTQAPGQKALAQAALWQTNVSSQATLAKWKSRVSAVTLNDWQLAMTNKGLPRVGPGATEASGPNGAETAFSTALWSYIQSGISNTTVLPPRGSYSQNITRMTNWANYMHGMTYTRGANVVPAYTVPGA